MNDDAKKREDSSLTNEPEVANNERLSEGQESEARTRGRYLKNFVTGIHLLKPSECEAVLTAVSPQTLKTIESANILSWYPVTLHLELASAVMQNTSKEVAHCFFRDNLVRALQSPLLATLVNGLIRLLDPDPGGAMEHMPKVYNRMFQGYGNWTIKRGSGKSVIAQQDHVAELLLADPDYMLTVPSTFCGLFEILHYHGDCQIAEIDPDQRSASFELTWTEKIAG